VRWYQAAAFHPFFRGHAHIGLLHSRRYHTRAAPHGGNAEGALVGSSLCLRSSSKRGHRHAPRRLPIRAHMVHQPIVSFDCP